MTNKEAAQILRINKPVIKRTSISARRYVEAFDMAISALSVPEREKREWIPTQNANDEIPKEGCYWVTFLDGKAIWVELIRWDTYYERWMCADDSYLFDQEEMKRIVAYMEFQQPEPYKEGGKNDAL